MQDKIELAKVKAFYYQKAVELGSLEDAKEYIQVNSGDGWGNGFFGFGEPTWSGDMYRIKPETVMHPGGEIPKPYLNASDFGAYVYVPDCRFDISKVAVVPSCREVINTNIEKSYALAFINAGLGHTTKEAAIAHAKVIYQIED